MSNIQKTIIYHERFISEKQDLIYLLSHDFKNFTGNSQGLAELILHENPSKEVLEYADLILQSTNQQFIFIDIFIKLIKDEDELSNRGLQTNTINLQEVFDSVTSQLGQKLHAKQIKLNTSSELEEAILMIDEDLLVRVVVNLVDNAIKFSFSNSEIKLSVSIVDDKVAFIVSDSGIGFDPKK